MQYFDDPPPVPGAHATLEDLEGVFGGLCAQSEPEVDATYLLVETSVEGQYLLGNAR
jgi:hypothetical protein